MNRFRGRKKNKDDLSASRVLAEPEPSGPFRMFGRKKSQEEEPKPQIDLTTALPSTDEFRTSLLMTGLSARFSMLREQDDPNSKLGKASDDSVLYPKRQSRLMDFGMGHALPDIAEIESIKSRPFARADSYVSSDDAASTNGSVMNRAKPTEGNNLFGGRQKIYKIAAGSSSKRGGMPGRALYDDDVAQSAFQKLRQADKQRQLLEQEEQDTVESDAHMDFNRRRETSSTTSSNPSASRTSTAATSVASSQLVSSVREWQSAANAAAGFANQSSAVERHQTRTRRLYDQGLAQDLQDQQASALSRMDTLSKKRYFNSRTPDLSPPVPPPAGGFGDRFLERRPIMNKASAPNLRSFSPPNPAGLSHFKPAETATKPQQPEPTKLAFGASPPLSPPMSEADEHSALPLQSNELGKATAMGHSNRPAQQYNETKFAQRQRQLQGRQVESSLQDAAARSRSGSAKRAPLPPSAPEIAVSRELENPTFFDDSDEASTDHMSILPRDPPQLKIERPSDNEHPAFRKSALPTPLSISSPRLSDEDVGSFDQAAKRSMELRAETLLDSPTLGPDSALSSMVRHHLRNDSTASSIYGPSDAEPSPASIDAAIHQSQVAKCGKSIVAARDEDLDAPTRSEASGGQDEFARHLADGARRVRERLTTFVESDTDRSTPNTPLYDGAREAGGVLRPSNGLGIIRSKSSRGSLFERDGSEPDRSKSVQSHTTALSHTASSPPRKPSIDDEEAFKAPQHRTGESSNYDGPGSSVKDDGVHVGLKAFRQARRELQKMRELETQQRHQPISNQSRFPDRAGSDGRPVAGGEALFESAASSIGMGRAVGDQVKSSLAPGRKRSESEAGSFGALNDERIARLRNGSVTREELGETRMPGARRPSQSARPLGALGGNVRHSPPRHGAAATYGMAINATHGAQGFDAPGRRMGRRRDVSDPNAEAAAASHVPRHPRDTPPYSRSRNGSLLSGATSTPNLHAAAAAAAAAATAVSAPPLPPLNPRRKNSPGGWSRSGDDGAGAFRSHTTPPGMYEGGYGLSKAAGAERRPDMYPAAIRRKPSNPNVRVQTSPQQGTGRPAVGRLNMPSNGLPGGMI
ncbi:hypothetical protein CDD81_6992 [Ophiocordyceps australis]|uniref:Uncharacterized protein n=1 Tax=Ophiocordyceps australis TaxID=1399860 RepID=A0A2C5YCS8_9HYPO|nr:hypothetical protein CDD81_6992 [Ophiocordyceps australis]